MSNRNKVRVGKIAEVTFFSSKTRMMDGEVESVEGGFYLEKSQGQKKLCYVRANLMVTMSLTKKSFQQLKRLTSGHTYEKVADAWSRGMYNDVDDYRDDMAACAAYCNKRKKEATKPKEEAPFIIQRFTPHVIQQPTVPQLDQ